MKIIVENSGYTINNVGDLSMLKVAIDRLTKLFPNSEIYVFTYAPNELSKHCPKAYPLNPVGRKIWFSPIVKQIYDITPATKIKELLGVVDSSIKNNHPNLARRLISLKLKRRLPQQSKEFEIFSDVLFNADLVVATGGGYITEAFKEHGYMALNTLELALKLKKPTVMFGQGIGPLENGPLLEKCKAVLPYVDLISLREKKFSLPLLQSIGVRKEQILVTGDDAIELAYQKKKTISKSAIGINLRVTGYSGFKGDYTKTLQAIGEILYEKSQKYNCELLPIPISFHSYGDELSDIAAIKQILEKNEYSNEHFRNLDSPEKIIQQVSRCRVVITGSYHAGVYALSQGIPVICFAKSDYYINKFMGLGDQFGGGYEVLCLEDSNCQEKLSLCIDRFWEMDDLLEKKLLKSAEEQITASKAAYQKLTSLI